MTEYILKHTMLPFSCTLFEGELQSEGEFRGGFQGQTVSSEAQLVNR